MEEQRILMEQRYRDGTRTRDGRFMRHKLSTGESELYSMYSRNIRVEGDGIAYNELNLVRAILLEPILYVIMGSNLLLAYTSSYSSSRVSERANKLAFVFAHALGFTFNIIRYIMACIVFIVEVIMWPLRVLLGLLFTPIGIMTSAGHIYGLPCDVVHSVLHNAGAMVVRRVRVKEIHGRPKTCNAGGLGQVNCYETNNFADASYIGYTFKIKQRCGNGPECVWVRGRRVFVSNWSPVSITSIFGNAKTKWKVMDLSNYEWRKMIFEFGMLDCDDERNVGQQEYGNHAGMWAFVRSFEDLGVVSHLADLELYYNSALGWNKYHRMRAEGERLTLRRYDRRLLAHFLALCSSLVPYFQFRDGSRGIASTSIELYALIIANYAFVSAYAAEILVGKACDVIDAKNDRYGVIVTRAIDRGFVRGFHVPNGKWLRYENGEETLPVHVVKGSEVNVTCSSHIYHGNNSMMIKVLSYHRQPPPFDLPWEGDAR